ncbi:hypothetical protein FZD05_19530 [Rossellomorea aquimaris]|nr:hypothetical protein FZD05_19530 [Rossellomorea aquimaris]
MLILVIQAVVVIINSVCYPSGLENGAGRNDRSSDITADLFRTLDTDIAEYMVPFCMQAYEEGYEETYIPTFWEKYKSFIFIFGIGFVFMCLYYYRKHMLYK